MDNTIRSRLETLLRRITLLMPASDNVGSSSSEWEQIYKNICQLVFNEPGYKQLWDVAILSRLNWLFQVVPPKQTVYGQQIAEIGQRVQEVGRVNDFFLQILNHDASVENVYEALSAVAPVESSLLSRLKSSNRLEDIRGADCVPSEKIAAFLDFLRDDVGLDLTNLESVKGSLDVLKAREGAGVVNALLVRTSGEGALVVPLQIKVQPGSGQVHCVVDGCEDFEATLKRARLAMLDRGFLREPDDIVCTLDFTESHYLGTSIGLAAAVAIYGSALA